MYKAIKVIFSVCAFGWFILTAVSLMAQDSGGRALFYSGNADYRQGQYEKAIIDYEKAAGQGVVSGNLYYNLGNAYFKKGEPGKAVLNYERAKIYIPADSDLKANYEYARAQLNLPEPSSPNWFLRVLDKVFEIFNVDGLAAGAVILFALSFGILAAAMFFMPLKKIAGALAIVLMLLAGLSGFELFRKIAVIDKGAVVTAKTAQARFEPLESATVYFDAPEGSLVEILEKHDNWYKVKRQDNKAGWVESPLLETIESI